MMTGTRSGGSSRTTSTRPIEGRYAGMTTARRRLSRFNTQLKHAAGAVCKSFANALFWYIRPMRNLHRALVCGLLLCVSAFAEKKVINPPEFAPAPGAAAPNFSPGILIDGTLYVSGQIGQDL